MTVKHREPLVVVNRVSKRYGTDGAAVTVLREVSLTISAGEFVAVIGPSGSGKSTLMNLTGLLDTPMGGTIRVAGTDAGQLSPDDSAKLRNRYLGFVFQFYHLMHRRSALANVELALIYRGVEKTERRERAQKALDQVGLGNRMHSFPKQLSGGEQQRVAIARALVTDPVLVLADEPTGALDTVASNQVIALLENACADGRAVMLVTHDPDVAIRASRVIELRDGIVVDDSRADRGIIRRIAFRKSARTAVAG